MMHVDAVGTSIREWREKYDENLRPRRPSQDEIGDDDDDEEEDAAVDYQEQQTKKKKRYAFRFRYTRKKRFSEGSACVYGNASNLLPTPSFRESAQHGDDGDDERCCCCDDDDGNDSMSNFYRQRIGELEKYSRSMSRRASSSGQTKKTMKVINEIDDFFSSMAPADREAMTILPSLPR